jgi:predicted lipoprotein with Yx(FWY)xxD motif
MACESGSEMNGRPHGAAFRLGRCAVGRVVIASLVAAVIGLLTACGSGAASAGQGGLKGAHRQGAASRSGVISARMLPGIGTVLVTSSGKTVYSPQQEAHGKILCTGGCLGFWFPVAVARGADLQDPGGVTGVLGTIHRAGGLIQLTYNGKPLYTFRLDVAPGQANGNNFTDHFGSASFTWHAVTTGGTPTGGSTSGPAYPGGSSGY